MNDKASFRLQSKWQGIKLKRRISTTTNFRKNANALELSISELFDKPKSDDNFVHYPNCGIKLKISKE